MNLVIIDDEADIGFILTFQLKMAGHEARCFDSTESAKKEIAPIISTIDAIICDFQMPGTNGLEFFEWSQSIGFKGPFYLLTGEVGIETQQLLARGVTAVLFKPQDLNKLNELLKS